MLIDMALFQPTLPLRGATVAAWARPTTLSCFNPRSPCGERLDHGGINGHARPVSTHAPLAGSDLTSTVGTSSKRFQPTLPLRGATQSLYGLCLALEFQPTLPLRGATTHSKDADYKMTVFQPTLPLRGATKRHFVILLDLGVSTHAPLAGSDAS